MCGLRRSGRATKRQKKEKRDKTDKTLGDDQEDPRPVNPLLLSDSKTPTDALPDGLSPSRQRARDYRLPAGEEGKKVETLLPLYGYEFFQPARDIIEMRRAYLRQRYQSAVNRNGDNRNGDSRGTRTRANDRSAKDGSKREDDTTGNSRKTRSQKEDDDRDSKDTKDSKDSKDTRDASGRSKRNDSEADNDGSSDRQTDETNADNPDTETDNTVPANGSRRAASKKTRDAADARNSRSQSNALDAEGSGGQRDAETLRAANTPVNAFAEVADPLSQLYRNVTASIPATYQVAGGDTLTVRYWSSKQEARTFTQRLSPQGSLSLPEMGTVVLRGMTLEQAEKALRTQMRRYYNGIDVTITLGAMRTIQVTVSGFAFQPGSYSVPAVATAYNLLYAAGGPAETGSLRGIEIRRQGRLIATLDMYHYWLSGTQADVPVQDGDLIYVPPCRSRIGVSGEVLRPALFELTPGETLQDALRYAGGVKASGVDQHIQINTLVPGTARVLKDINLQEARGTHVPLYDGDRVDVFSVRELLTNRVTIEGAVDQPSDYALSPNMRVSDLLQSARGTLGDAFLTRADLYRWQPDASTTLIPIDLEKAIAHDPKEDITLTRWDRLKVYTRQEVAWSGQRALTVRGAVSRPGTYTRSGNMHVADLLLLAGGPAPDAYLNRAVLLHQHGDGTFAMDYVNLGDLSRLNATDKGPRLEDNDVLAVYRVGEAEFMAEHAVTIRGEVVAPGPYPRTENMRLSDLLKLSGGFKPGAGTQVSIAHLNPDGGGANGGVVVSTVQFDAQRNCPTQSDALLADGDMVTVQGTGGLIDHVQTITVRGAVNHPGPIVLASKNMRLSDALKAAGGLRPEAFPEGAEFNRNPRLMSTVRQRTLTDAVGQLNDLLNEQSYNREKGKSYVERIKATREADDSDTSLLGQKDSAPAPNGTTQSLSQKLAQQELVSPARRLSDGQVSPSGDLAVNVPAILRRPGGNDDIQLVDGDIITIPEQPTTIQVVGAVFHSTGVVYKPGATLDYYITQTGGFAPDAARDRMEVIHVGGGMTPADKAHALAPGDVILVPTKVLAEKIARKSSGISDFFKSLTSSAIVFKLAGSLFGL